MPKIRLDKLLVSLGLAETRSQAEDLVRRGFVSLRGKIVIKPESLVDKDAAVKIRSHETFVSRAGEKLNSVVDIFKLNFSNKVILDVGSSTGGFSDLAIRRGARKVIAVEVGTNQMDPKLLLDKRIELHEKTDIRDFKTNENIEIVLIDVSFISLRDVLPSIVKLSNPRTDIVAMVKPQFEVRGSDLKHKGVIKNDHIRRAILKEFENWSRSRFTIVSKADSSVAGNKGNLERFYLLRLRRSPNKS